MILAVAQRRPVSRDMTSPGAATHKLRRACEWPHALRERLGPAQGVRQRVTLNTGLASTGMPLPAAIVPSSLHRKVAFCTGADMPMLKYPAKPCLSEACAA